MKRKHSRLIAAVIVSFLAIGAFAGRAVANSSGFGFTMEQRYVNGEKNKQLHALDAGELTFSGNVWVTSKNVGATSAPEVIEIAVWKIGVLGSRVCAASVTPNTIFNDKRSFSRSCGRIEGGTYWIEVSRKKVDGWHIKGSGALATK